MAKVEEDKKEEMKKVTEMEENRRLRERMRGTGREE
jgi:hypothetical protein